MSSPERHEYTDEEAREIFYEQAADAGRQYYADLAEKLRPEFERARDRLCGPAREDLS